MLVLNTTPAMLSGSGLARSVTMILFPLDMAGIVREDLQSSWVHLSLSAYLRSHITQETKAMLSTLYNP